MTAPQFTPGPWRVLSGAILSESLNKYGNWIVVDAPLRGKIQSPESIVEDEANLRLMASAPELYAALKSLVARLDSMTTEDFVHCQYHIDKTIAEHVLAKAEGRAPKAL